MKNHMEKMTAQYIKDVKEILPFVRKSEKEYLNLLKVRINGYIEANRMTDFKYVIERFGTPADAAMDYIDTLDEKTLMKMQRRTKYLKCAVFTALAVSVATNVYIYKKLSE